ncbi:MAG: hypothetical protein JWM09_15 [Francisellaceae bacterium]|nr:hypothetical protein [Francisellaceae bacterium]
MTAHAPQQVEQAAWSKKNSFLALSGNVHFDNVSALLKQGLLLIDEFSDIKIDLSQVIQSDSSILALLVALLRDATEKNKAIHFYKTPHFIKEIISVCGLESILRDN